MSIQKSDANQKTPADPNLYEHAHAISFGRYFAHRVRRFVNAVNEEIELGPDQSYGDRTWNATDAKVAEVFGHASDDPLQLLLVYEDETRQYVGEDETSKAGSELFTFYVYPNDEYPMVRTVDEALSLLKTPGVDQALIDGVGPKRQGEWWLLEDQGEPAGSVFRPGVGERPFGESPLGNHVPREYGFGVPDDVFVERFVEHTPELAGWIDTVDDAVWHVMKAGELEALDGFELLTDVPSPSEIREMAEGIYVRGTLRHRESEHYLETIGDEWHRAETHDMDVWTVDSFQLFSSSGSSTRGPRID